MFTAPLWPFGRLFSKNIENSRLSPSIYTLSSLFFHKPLTYQGLDFDANQRIDSRRDSRHTITARIKVDSHERYHDSKYLGLYFDHFFLVTNHEHSLNKNV